MAEEGHEVFLHVYDLSQGLARQLSRSFLGKAIEGIWHTGVVVYGNEYYFGGGIQHSPAATTPYGTPLRVVKLGTTHIPKEVFEEYLSDIRERYTAETYSLLFHNCNTFSNEVAQFLVGEKIPKYILELPNEVMNSPMGGMILPMIDRLDSTLRVGAVPQAPQFKPASAMAAASQPTTATSASTASSASVRLAHNSSNDTGKSENRPTEVTEMKREKPKDLGGEVPPAVVPGGAPEIAKSDPLGDARSKLQEEICSEFAAIMASGTLRASEAAALATRRVMEKHGRLGAAASQS